MSVASFSPEDDARDARITAGSEDFIAAVSERISVRGRQERQWFEDWKADYHAAGEAGDNDGCELLLDILVAFDALLAKKRPNCLRRVA